MEQRTLFEPRDVWSEPAETDESPRIAGPLELPSGPYSSSRLQLLLECPRHFWMKYIARVPEPREQRDPFEVGSRVHNGIESACNATMESRRPSEWIVAAVREALDGMDPIADERKISRIRHCLLNAYRWMLRNDVWARWAWGIINVEEPFAVDREGRFLKWDGDLRAKPEDAELCFILDLCVRYQYTGVAYLYDWKAGWKRRRPLTDGIVDPQLLLYAYGLFCADPSLQIVYATFFNVMWTTPEPAIGLSREVTIAAARKYIEGCEREMYKRPVDRLASWEGTPGKSCFFCTYQWDCLPKQAERFQKARRRLVELPDLPEDHPAVLELVA